MAVITNVAYDFCPMYWALCNGQLLAINTNQALFSLLGTTYGGNGVNTFGLPNLQGRSAVGVGTLAGGSNYTLGQSGGAESATLNVTNLPAHTHSGAINLSMKAGSANGSDTIAENNVLGSGVSNTYSTNDNANFTTPTYQTTIGTAGSGQPFTLLSPYLAMNYIICTYGIFPSRN